jgi:dihydroorotase (multifunctional complex type)
MSRLIRIAGMLDPHTHLRDLDWAHKATFASETGSALAGGYWAVLDMPNTPPTTISADTLNRKRSALQAGAHCDWGIYAGASQANNTAEYAHMAASCCGLKIFNNATTGDLLISDQTQRYQHYAAWHSATQPMPRLIAVHAEEDTVLDLLECVRRYRVHTHFLHISTAREIAYLRSAKAEGLPVSIGICPHHLFLSQEDLPRLGAFGLMKPELKTPADVRALWSALAEGLIDVIESDHAPHSLVEKQSSKPPYGVAGLETTLPLMLTAVHEGRLTLDYLIQLVADNPRRLWGLACPPDTYTLVDLDASYTIQRHELHSACGWSPFEGVQVQGRVRETWIRGQRVYADGEVLSPAGFGRDLFGGMS